MDDLNILLEGLEELGVSDSQFLEPQYLTSQRPLHLRDLHTIRDTLEGMLKSYVSQRGDKRTRFLKVFEVTDCQFLAPQYLTSLSVWYPGGMYPSRLNPWKPS